MNAEIASRKGIAHRGVSGLFLEANHYPSINSREQRVLWPTVVVHTDKSKRTTQKRAKSPNVDRQNPDGNTALHYAAFNGELGKTRLLLMAGANPNIRNLRGDSPLICAAYNGHCDVIMALVANDAELDAQDEDGRSALTWAVIRGQTDVVRLLISLGANLSICDNVDNTPLIWALINDRREICEILVEAEEKFGNR